MTKREATRDSSLDKAFAQNDKVGGNKRFFAG